MVCDDADLRRRPVTEQPVIHKQLYFIFRYTIIKCFLYMLKIKSNVNIPGVDTLMEQEPFTEHGKEDSKLVFSWDDAITASTQGIPGVY